MQLFSPNNRKAVINTIFQGMKICITIAILLFFISKVDFSIMAKNWTKITINGRWWYLLTAVIVDMVMLHVILVLRWQHLMGAYAINLPFWRLLEYQYISDVYTIILPGSVGGDVVKGLFVLQEGEKSHVMNSVIVARIFGLMAVAVFVILSFVFFSGKINTLTETSIFPLFWDSENASLHTITDALQKSPRLIVYSAMAFLGFILICFFSIIIFSEKIKRYLDQHIPLKGLLQKIHIYNSITSLGRMRTLPVFIPTLLYSFLIQAGLIVNFWCIFQALGFDAVTLQYCFLTIPIIFVVSLIPVSIFALGLREFMIGLFMVKLIEGWLLGEMHGSGISVSALIDYLQSAGLVSLETIRGALTAQGIDADTAISTMRQNSLNDVLSITLIYYMQWIVDSVIGTVFMIKHSILKLNNSEHKG